MQPVDPRIAAQLVAPEGTVAFLAAAGRLVSGTKIQGTSVCILTARSEHVLGYWPGQGRL